MSAIAGSGLTAVGGLMGLRDRLADLGFTWPTVQERLGLQWVIPFPADQLEDTDTPLCADDDRPGIDWIIKLLLLGEPVVWRYLEAALGTSAGVLLESGMAARDGDEVTATVFVLPFQGLQLVCDNPRLPDSDRVFVPDPSTVFVANGLGGRPGEPSHLALDLATGSGVHTLLLARRFDRSVGLDLSARAIDFARFNAELNGVANAEFEVADGLTSDAAAGYGPVDLLTANLPLVYPYFRRHAVSYGERSQYGEALLRAVYQILDRVVSPEGHAVLWHQVLLDPSESYDEILQQTSAAERFVATANLFSLGHAGWAFNRCELRRRAPEDTEHLRIVPAPRDFLGCLHTRDDVIDHRASQDLVAAGGEALAGAVPSFYDWVTHSVVRGVVDGRLTEVQQVVAGHPDVTADVLDVAVKVDGSATVASLLADAGLAADVAAAVFGELVGRNIVRLRA